MRRALAPAALSATLLAPVALASMLALAGCSGKQAAPAQQPAEVGVVTLKTEPVTLSNELTGRVTAVNTADVRPQVDGLIRDRLFEEGSMVRAGQPLYQIDPRLYRASLGTAQAQLESAQATLANADAKLKRYQSLSDPTAVSRQDLDDTLATSRTSKASVHQYQASVQTAKVNLEYTRVLAPITGRIGRSAYTKGALVSASQSAALATIQQLDPIYVDITQSSADLLRLRMALAKGSIMPTNAKVSLKLEDGTPYPLQGSVEFSEVNVDANAGTVTLRAKFPNPHNLLLPGMFVSVATPQATMPNGILAPQQGVTRDPRGNATALVVDAHNKVVLRQITVDKVIGTSWLVSKGLSAGDRLIVEGADKVQPGATVRPVAANLDK
ncbi:MAG TPA: efflux RND transporter periplasmic adaptor subunit [Novosphingobium sp.]|nr:efflux RND transporter periplasmic adaptor subunit [Novosphingobium sp.]